MESSGVTRREVIAGAFGFAVAGRAEARSPQTETENTLETAERRQVIHKQMVERWFEPQPDCEGKTGEEMLSELETTMGEWIVIFKHLNQIDDALHSTMTLQDRQPDDSVWSEPTGPAAGLEQLYNKYWNAETFAVERQQPKQVAIENADLVGFSSQEEYQEFFADGEFVPRGWLSAIKKIQLAEKSLSSIFVGPIKGQSVHTPADFMHKESQRVLRLGGFTAMNGQQLLETRLGEIYHEINHANDWDTGHYPADLKIKTYWRVVQRMQQPDNGGTSLTTETYHQPNASGYERWRNAMEYWAEISTQYFQNTPLAPEDQKIVKTVVDATDPDYDPNYIAPRIEAMAIAHTVKQLDVLVMNESIRIMEPDKRRKFEEAWAQYKTTLATTPRDADVYNQSRIVEQFCEVMKQQLPEHSEDRVNHIFRLEEYLRSYDELIAKSQAGITN